MNLKSLREKYNLQQGELATVLEINQALISIEERYGGGLSLEKKSQIEKFFGVHINWHDPKGNLSYIQNREVIDTITKLLVKYPKQDVASYILKFKSNAEMYKVLTGKSIVPPLETIEDLQRIRTQKSRVHN